MAATTLSFSLALDSPQPHLLKAHSQPSLNSGSSKALSLSYTSSSSYPVHPLPLHKSYVLQSTLPSSSSHSSSSSSSPSPSSSPTSSDTYLNNPSPAGKFLDPKSLEKSEFLKNFSYIAEVRGGLLSVRVMEEDEVETTVTLLAESFAESLLVPSQLLGLLEFMVRQYVRERRAMQPHVATLVGFVQGEDGKKELVGTVEISFDAHGANASPPTPIPPMDSPYICNMAVRKKLRRRGVGWNLLQASERLISLMTMSREVYLHCRMIDTIPLNMYKKAGYSVVKTDSLLTLLTFQRRKHLMHKKLPEPNSLHLDVVGAIDGPTS